MTLPYKLPPEFKKRWVEALRSGTFRQGIGALKRSLGDGNGKFEHCCLGVAIEVLHPEKPETWDHYTNSDVLKWRTVVGGVVGYLGSDGEEHEVDLALEQPAEPLGLSGSVEDNLVQWNDGTKKFGWIADWIEENL